MPLAILRTEPYRLFFPLGILAGIWGVMLWPLYYSGHLSFHPGEAHTRIMIQGFMGAFVTGFVGTAFPRLVSHQTWSRGEWTAQLALWLLAFISHVTGHVDAGDAAFSGLIGVLLLCVAIRWFHRRGDTPPPGFVLMPPALIGTLIATWLMSRPGLDLTQTQWAKLWLYQAFPLLPLMGIAPYLLPRFFGHDSLHSFETSAKPPVGWWPKAITALAALLLILTSFALEVAGHATAGHLLRALTVTAWFALECPALWRKAKTPGTAANACRWAVLSILGGWVAACVWPAARVASLHLFFASGIALITLAVATRVILGHAGRHDLLGGKRFWLRCLIGLLILASTTRLSADLIPKVQISHYIYASWTWAIAALLWTMVLGRFLWKQERDEEKPSKCPKRHGR